MALVLLDRDGVLNEDSPGYIKSVDEWRPLAGSLAAVARMKQAGFAVAVCTNQSAIARGLTDACALEAIHALLRRELADHGVGLDGIYVCPHGPDDGCACRKPRPGLLERAMTELGHAAQSTWYIGDAIRDVQAALAAGCTPVLVRTGNGTAAEREARGLGVELVFDDLDAAADWLVQPR